MKLKPEFFNIERPIKISSKQTYTFYESASDQHDRVYVPKTEKDFNEFIDVLLALTQNPTEEELKNYNLIKKYPFLFIKNVWDGGIYLYKNNQTNTFYRWFEFTEINWLLSLNEKRTLKFIDDLTNYFDSISSDMKYKYFVLDIKEKYGTLRWYDNGNTTEGYEIISQYCSDMEPYM